MTDKYLSYTAAEFGAMRIVFDKLSEVKTKKESDSLLRMLSSFIKSMSSITTRNKVSKKFTILNIIKKIIPESFEIIYFIQIVEYE
jgi:hypothetical protein